MVKGTWDRVVLREICDSVKYGYTASAKPEPIGPKFLRITDIVPNHIDWSAVPHCEIDKDNLSKYLLEKDDIVIARTGATTGYAKRIRTKQYAIFASYLVRIRINSKCDSKYIGHVIESDEYKRFIQLNIGGAAQPHANAQILTSFSILLPPLQTQQKIAAILSTYDDLIENNTHRIKILEDMAQTLYQEWFVHYRFPGHENVQMVQSELGPIPQGWKVSQLGDLAESIRQNVKAGKVEQQSPYFGLEHLPRKSIALSDWDLVDAINSTKLIFEIDDILFSVKYVHISIKLDECNIANGRGSSDTIVVFLQYEANISHISSPMFRVSISPTMLKTDSQEEDTMGKRYYFQRSITKFQIF